MKALTLHQPWASLVAIGAKRIETRSWPTNYRGPLAIHAGQNRDYLDLCCEEPFRSALRAAGILGPADLPFGCVLATVNLINCLDVDLIERFVGPFTDQERAFGNYGKGRFGWVFYELRRLDRPSPAMGRQGLWEWKENVV